MIVIRAAIHIICRKTTIEGIVSIITIEIIDMIRLVVSTAAKLVVTSAAMDDIATHAALDNIVIDVTREGVIELTTHQVFYGNQRIKTCVNCILLTKNTEINRHACQVI